MSGVKSLDNNSMMPYRDNNYPMSDNRQQLLPDMDKKSPCSTYPDIYYRLMPYIMMVCDQAEANGVDMPSQEMIESISDNIYEDMMRNYPDMAEYIRRYEQNPDRAASLPVQGPFFFGRRPRRRGPFRDLIDILLLSEFARRRRRRRYPFYY
ncbi:MAG: hypothetical protein GX193_06985 [Clostridiales bacterium]|nr:hypothetical protein [Clostridiales bacterium]